MAHPRRVEVRAIRGNCKKRHVARNACQPRHCNTHDSAHRIMGRLTRDHGHQGFTRRKQRPPGAALPEWQGSPSSQRGCPLKQANRTHAHQTSIWSVSCTWGLILPGGRAS